MAGLVVTQEGATLLWQWMLGILTPTNPIVHLFGSAHTPAHTDTESTYAAIELPSANGYAPIVLTSPGTNWTITPDPVGAKATHTAISWTFTAALTVYGYWLSDNSGTISLWAEAFNPAYVFLAGGGVFPLTLPPLLFSQP